MPPCKPCGRRRDQLIRRAARWRKKGAPREELPWATLSPETFARAKAEHKYIVLDGSAEWCHWCHVMEATTYHDPEVRKILDKHFIAVKVDVDSRPDVEERYGDYGWPATVMFCAGRDGARQVPRLHRPREVHGHPRGHRRERLAEKRGDDKPKATPRRRRRALSEEHLAWIAARDRVQLEDYYDEDQGSWGRQQKAPLGWNNAWTLEQGRGRRRRRRRRRRSSRSTSRARCIDPVWGGIYQYSAARDWDSPHFEKLMTFQAPRARQLRHARTR